MKALLEAARHFLPQRGPGFNPYDGEYFEAEYVGPEETYSGSPDVDGNLFPYPGERLRVSWDGQNFTQSDHSWLYHPDWLDLKGATR